MAIIAPAATHRISRAAAKLRPCIADENRIARRTRPDDALAYSHNDDPGMKAVPRSGGNGGHDPCCDRQPIGPRSAVLQIARVFGPGVIAVARCAPDIMNRVAEISIAKKTGAKMRIRLIGNS